MDKSRKSSSGLRAIVAPLHLVALVVNLRLSRYDWPSVKMGQSTPLNEAQKVALDKLTAAVGPKYVEFLAAKGPDVLNARVETFMQYETALLGRFRTK